MEVQYFLLDSILYDDNYKAYLLNNDTINYIRKLIGIYYSKQEHNMTELLNEIELTNGKIYRDINQVIELENREVEVSVIDHYKKVVDDDFHRLQEYIWTQNIKI